MSCFTTLICSVFSLLFIKNKSTSLTREKVGISGLLDGILFWYGLDVLLIFFFQLCKCSLGLGWLQCVSHSLTGFLCSIRISLCSIFSIFGQKAEVFLYVHNAALHTFVTQSA